MNRRREGFGVDFSRIDHHQAADGGEPKPSVAAAATGGLAAPFALQNREAVGLAIGDTLNAMFDAVGKLVQLAFCHSEDSQIGTEPILAPAIVGNVAYHVVHQALARGTNNGASVFEAYQAAAVSADPQRAVRLGPQCPNKVAAQPVFA